MHLTEIENEIKVFGSAAEMRWQKIAEMIIKVEKEGLWQEDPSNRNFTAWLESLDVKVGMSKSRLWSAYTAAKVLTKIASRKLPKGADLPTGKIFELFPNCSMGALNTFNSLEIARVKDEFRHYLEDEYLQEKVSVTALSTIGKEIKRCRRLGLNNAEAFAAILKLNFAETLGLAKTRQRIITDLPVGADIDAVCVLPTSDGKPDFIGIAIWTKKPIVFPDSVDWRIVIKSHLDSDIPAGPFGVLSMDFLSGKSEVIRPCDRAPAEQASKSRLSLAIINAMLAPGSNPIDPEISD